MSALALDRCNENTCDAETCLKCSSSDAGLWCDECAGEAARWADAPDEQYI